MYRAAGWLGTLPIGNQAGTKYPPPHGWTGHGAPYPSAADVGAWQETHGDRNIGIRMPAGIIGLDVDTYVKDGHQKPGAATLAELEQRLGPLPDTWVSSARPAPSGIRWFRVPLQLDGRDINWPGEAGKGIEIIQAGHRYAVVWPSTNPEADGAPYKWRHPDVKFYGPDEFVPGSDGPDIANLPDAWVRGLALAYDRTQKADLAGSGLAAWWGQLRAGDSCPVVRTVLDRGVREVITVAGSRHESARDAAAALARLGGEGHRGAAEALNNLGAVLNNAIGPQRAAAGEWSRLLSGAVKLAAGDNPTPRQSCEHDTVSALPVDMVPPGFWDVRAAAAVQHRTRLDEMVAEVDRLDPTERAEAVRRAIPEIASWATTEQDSARDQLTVRSGLTDIGVTDFRSMLKDELKRLKLAAEQAAHDRARAAAAEQVDRARTEGTLLPPPHAPIEVARQLATRMTRPARWWRGDFYRHDGTRYVQWRDEAVDNWLYGQTADAWFDAGEEKGTSPWRPTENKITGVSHALSRGVLYRPSEDDPEDSPTQVACANGVYDVPTRQLLPHTPDRFNLQSVPFPYDPAAQAPSWQTYLDQVLPPDAQAFLQEWTGYLISGRTDLEKIANLVGRPRSGKGTFAATVEALLGGENVASPSMSGLVGTFGEQPLIGKSLAVFSDISWAHRDVAAGVEILKAISGQDTRDVNRKNREAWHGRLGVRFMIMGNDMPRFTDASGALAGRMIHVQFPGTVAGREDPTLKPRLLTELPGILNWALAGLERLTANGRFTVPQTSEDLAAEVRRQQSPVQAFLDDTCAMTDAANPVPLDELFPVYRAWSRAADVDHPLDRERFSRALASAGLAVRRGRIDGVRARWVHGVVPATLTAWTELLNPAGTFPPGPVS